jgi:translation initiation factor 2 beta subunit (eIF-2beta)/eIF-5
MRRKKNVVIPDWWLGQMPQTVRQAPEVREPRQTPSYFLKFPSSLRRTMEEPRQPRPVSKEEEEIMSHLEDLPTEIQNIIKQEAKERATIEELKTKIAILSNEAKGFREKAEQFEHDKEAQQEFMSTAERIEEEIKKLQRELVSSEEIAKSLQKYIKSFKVKEIPKEVKRATAEYAKTITKIFPKLGTWFWVGIAGIFLVSLISFYGAVVGRKPNSPSERVQAALPWFFSGALGLVVSRYFLSDTVEASYRKWGYLASVAFFFIGTIRFSTPIKD